jgi:hypothetical protein
MASTYRRSPNGAGIPEASDILRVDEAVAAAVFPRTTRLRSYVSPHIGTDAAFKSMEEFEALQFLPAESLTSAQVDAMKVLRASIPDPVIGNDIVKVTSLSDAMNRLGSGDGSLNGFFTRQADIGGMTTASDFVERLRLDYHGSPFSEGEAFAVINTKVNTSIASNARVPKQGGFGGGSGDMSYADDYPYVGNGFAASRDGNLTPEWRVQNASQMPADVTVISFKNADGSPRVVTVGQAGSSDRWVLRQVDPNDPSLGHVWETLP